MDKLSKQETIIFWKSYSAEFAGDIIYPEIIRLSKRYIGTRVLDVGAGSGALIRHIRGAIGLDLVPKLPRILPGDIVNLPFRDEVFDTIFACEILEHLDDDSFFRGLSEINRILKKHAYVIITVPFREELERETVICPKCFSRFHRWGHLQVFDQSRIKQVLESLNFKIVNLILSPLGLVAVYPFLRYFRFILIRLKYLRTKNLFVVARKI